MRRVPFILILLAATACRTKDVAIDTQGSDSLGESGVVVDEDGDGVPSEEDCDDTDASAYPGADEVCDGVDNNCDGQVDEDSAVDAQTWYSDADGDGFGDGDAAQACEPPADSASQDGDCDDDDAAFYPGAPEEDCADPNDYNCDGSVGYEDADGDGWAACEECDDADPAVHPDATEVCDGLDNDCDTLVDDLDDSLDATSGATFYEDRDSDGYGVTDFFTQACEAPTGYATVDGDCDDAEPAINPGATEVCDGLDNDCDTLVDDADSSLDSSTAGTWYSDGDGDGYGDANSAAQSCTPPNGSVADATDCDDANAAINPGVAEVCDGLDNDCDTLVDDADSSLDLSTASTWFTDADADGWGQSGSGVDACLQPSGTVTNDSDCDDTDATQNLDDADADGRSSCDGDCDDTDASLSDVDADADGQSTCDGDCDDTDPTLNASDNDADGQSTCTGDCDDTDPTASPGSLETCDGVDNDCDATVDEGVLGTGASCPAADCAAIIADNPNATDGTYTLTAGQYTCEMSTDSGGWTQVASAAHLFGTSYDTTAYNSEGFTYGEVLFRHNSGSVHAHCTYPGSLTGCNNVGFQFDNENWGVAQNWGSSLCGLSTTDYTSATRYIGGTDFVISRASNTSTIRVGTLEGIARCTIGDNPGNAYMDIFVR